LMRLKSIETFCGLVGSIMTPTRMPGRTIGMYSRGTADFTTTGYVAPGAAMGVTWQAELVNGASGPTDGEVMVVPVSAIPR